MGKLKELRDKQKSLELQLATLDEEIKDFENSAYDEILSVLLKELSDYQEYSDDYAYENVLNNTLCVLSSDAIELLNDYI